MPHMGLVENLNRTLDLLYEDPHLLVVNKPSGLLTHPVNNPEESALSSQLAAYTALLSTLSGEDRPGIVHRLDKDTEGLLLIAKNNDIHAALKTQFQEKTIQKRYYAISKGNVIDDDLHIALPITRHPHRRHTRMISKTAPNRREAATNVHVLKRFGTKTLLDVHPITGRTHQIRVHLAHIGHPIIGDPLYGKTPKKSGQLLQAYQLQFIHPITQKIMRFRLPISERLR